MRDFVFGVWGRMSRTTASGPHRIASAMRRGPVLWLTVCGGLLVAAIILGTAIAVGEFRERALRNSERELENTVLLLTRHFDEQFKDADFVAADLISQMQLSGITSAAMFRQRMLTSESHRMLRSRASVLSYVGEVTIVDADGELINWSGDMPLPALHVAERGYFKTFKSDPTAPAVLAEPIHSFLTGAWTTIIAHRLTGADGVFLGVMARRIDAANFEKFFASVALGKGAAISMFHRDGTMLARYPHVESMIGQKFKKAPLLQSVLDRGGQQTLRRAKPGRPAGPARFGGRVKPLPDGRRRDQDRCGRAGRLARANQASASPRHCCPHR